MGPRAMCGDGLATDFVRELFRKLVYERTRFECPCRLLRAPFVCIPQELIMNLRIYSIYFEDLIWWQRPDGLHKERLFFVWISNSEMDGKIYLHQYLLNCDMLFKWFILRKQSVTFSWRKSDACFERFDISFQLSVVTKVAYCHWFSISDSQLLVQKFWRW